MSNVLLPEAMGFKMKTPESKVWGGTSLWAQSDSQNNTGYAFALGCMLEFYGKTFNTLCTGHREIKLNLRWKLHQPTPSFTVYGDSYRQQYCAKPASDDSNGALSIYTES